MTVDPPADGAEPDSAVPTGDGSSEQGGGRRVVVPRQGSIGRWLTRLGVVAAVVDPIDTATSYAATEHGQRRAVHLTREDGGHPTDATIAEGRLAPRTRTVPRVAAIVAGITGLALVSSWLFLPSPLRDVLFWVGLTLFLLAVLTPLATQSQARLTDSTAAARRIARTGTPGLATVTAVQQTSTRINVEHNVGDWICDLDLSISPEGAAAPYPVRKRLAVDRFQMQRLAPGLTFEVRIDPADPTNVVLP
jgi:hypothetical protein